MFDLPLPLQPSPRPMGPVANGGTVASDPSLPFALTRIHRTPAALMSGTAAPVVVERFATLADAMQGAFELAEENGPMQRRSFWPSLIATSAWFLPEPPVMALWLGATLSPMLLRRGPL